MNRSQIVTRSLRYYSRSNVALALGVAVATAVMTGALLVGESVRGSLRDLVTERLGEIDYALAAPQPFRAKLADELAAAEGFAEHFDLATPALLLQATVTHRADGQTRRVSDVQLLGVTHDFGRFDNTHDKLERAWDIPPGEAWITPNVAHGLGVSQGDDIFLLLPSTSAIPADSPLGEKQDTTVGQRFKVGRILPDHGIARFTLQPTQRPPSSVFVSLADAQQAVELEESANLLLVGAEKPDADGGEWLDAALRPTLEDYGVSLRSAAGGKAVQIESRQLVLSDKLVEIAEQALADEPRQPVVTYLANTLRDGEKSIAYSMVSGIDSLKSVGPLRNGVGEPIELGPDEVALNDWAAEALGAKLGDEISLTYYAPESTHGELTEEAPLRLRLAAIAPLQDGNGKPTAAADPALTPQLEGVTDADSINDWDLPFELTEPITQADEDYWDAHSTTPKAFVSLSTAKRLWATRWGTVSLLRVAAPADRLTDIAARLRDAIAPADLGLVFRPIKQQGLAAASGTTPFDGLFFGFSIFLIGSAVLLIALLFRLGVEQRARQVGVLGAVGWTAPQIRKALTKEGLIVAELGAAVGVLGGIAYAWLMLAGLRTLWVDAIVTPFIFLHLSPLSLGIGYLVGLFVAWAAIAWSLRGLLKESTRTLLSGGAHDTASAKPPSRYGRWLRPLLLTGAGGLAVLATTLRGEAQAGAFFTCGVLALTLLVLEIRRWMVSRNITHAAPRRYGINSLALRNLARTPTRSLLTIALVGSASFLILAIGAFRLPPTEAGTGGYDLVAQSDQPLHYDLNTADGRREYAFRRGDSARFANWQIDSLRVYDGEDASCLNLYQTSQPRVLGAPEGFEPPFDWADFRSPRSLKGASGWTDLATDLGADEDGRPVVPVVLDFNTAMYSLKLYGGVGSRLTIEDSAQSEVTLEVVGLLKNSLLQGDLLMSEANFLRLFPDTGGYRFFLVRSKLPDAKLDSFAGLLEDRLSDYGLDVQPARDRLAGFLAVQNTYLSTFQTLGALGLLLGAVGVAVVQLRNVAQRRGELALLRAAGFTAGRLESLVLRENLALLAGGLATGALAALVPLAPQALQHNTRFPWLSTAALVGVIAVVGLVVGWLATRKTIKLPLLPALRSE
ncbi:FtsX-like permease family protein [Posidoniimonas polymericola]|uniref:FtsX-like permease family protein n=1 Tax=Posidoniimonas polymericola TaxID=2528002 RepID=A0A5C5XVV6_9BACT|nr:FtsX-like permease family protein [Posidoniimonas polymericola]TWT66828.1 FtsX-like permease family protein [Posidoniimonas polymericola]